MSGPLRAHHLSNTCARQCPRLPCDHPLLEDAQWNTSSIQLCFPREMRSQKTIGKNKFFLQKYVWLSDFYRTSFFTTSSTILYNWANSIQVRDLDDCSIRRFFVGGSHLLLKDAGLVSRTRVT